MNKRRRRSLRRRLIPQPSDSISRPPRLSVKRFIGGSSLALCGAISIYFVTFHSFKPGTPAAKVSVIAPTPLPVKESSPPPRETDQSIVTSLAEADQPHQEALAVESSSNDLTPAPTPNGTPAVQTSLNGNDSVEGKRSEAERKSVERQRREAERKRSRLESEYQKHAISDDTYKKGQEEYKNEIEKYRAQLNGSGTNNE